jgi:hypothetical protein
MPRRGADARGAAAGRCECACTRAWLPPASLWLFAPREHTHAAGGWSFECAAARRGEGAEAAALPVIAVLTAAFHTLDRERGLPHGVLGAARAALAWLRGGERG